MSYNGRVNVDALVHDTTTGAIKVLDLESSELIATKAALITGTATFGGFIVDPTSTGYKDSSGDAVTFSDVTAIVIQNNDSSEAVRVMGSTLSVFAAPNKCAVSYTSNQGTNTFSVIGAGVSFSLLLIGE